VVDVATDDVGCLHNINDPATFAVIEGDPEAL
jgi:hypothetical protein